ncbi:hypothetical protein KI387_017188, partial [Taxus chinensis]
LKVPDIRLIGIKMIDMKKLMDMRRLIEEMNYDGELGLFGYPWDERYEGGNIVCKQLDKQ